MKRYYKNTINFNHTLDPSERIKDISKNIIEHSTNLPKTITYEDIDREFKDWVDNQILIVQDGVKLPTMVLYSNQRFSEYMQTWQYTDENNNIRLNFKTVTRENNPSHGTILGETYNIPGDRFYKIKSVNAIDESGKRYRLDYKMKLPTPVDLIYKVSVMTNKYTAINEFNETINRIFNARQAYICPNGHYMPLTLENINDESEYNIEDRQFFSQSITIKVKGYIIKQEDLRVEENPATSLICFEGDTAKRKKNTIELSEYDPCYVEEDKYYKKPIDIDIDLGVYPCKGKSKFTMDEDFILTGISIKEFSNIYQENIKLYINDVLITNNLLKDAFEGYTKCENIPIDITNDNVIECDKLPEKFDKYHKYILFENEYYKWHQIHFSDGDEIIIQTKKINCYKESSGLILMGYNRFVVCSVEE